MTCTWVTRFALCLCAFVGLGGAMVAGCSDSLPAASRIAYMRVIGHQVTVDGAPASAMPEPGDDIEMDVWVAFPQEQKAMAWNFAACVPENSTGGIPVCDDFPFDIFVQETPALGAPSFSLTIPDESTLGDAEEIVIIGAICAEGAARSLIELATLFEGDVSDDLDGCVNPSNQGALAFIQVPVAREADDLHEQPRFMEVTYDDVTWSDNVSPLQPVRDCADLGILTITSRSPVASLGMTAVSGSLESYEELSGDTTEDRVEELQIAIYSTSGVGDRTYSFITEDDLAPTMLWEPPRAGVPPDGLLVRFYFTMRDGRGGTDRVDRAICVLP